MAPAAGQATVREAVPMVEDMEGVVEVVAALAMGMGVEVGPGMGPVVDLATVREEVPMVEGMVRVAAEVVEVAAALVLGTEVVVDRVMGPGVGLGTAREVAPMVEDMEWAAVEAAVVAAVLVMARDMGLDMTVVGADVADEAPGVIMAKSKAAQAATSSPSISVPGQGGPGTSKAAQAASQGVHTSNRLSVLYLSSIPRATYPQTALLMGQNPPTTALPLRWDSASCSHPL